MFERFTDRARKVMALANEEAQRLHHDQVGAAHLLLGLVNEGSGVGANVLVNLGVDLGAARREVEKSLPMNPGPSPLGNLPHSDSVKKVIASAIGEARGLDHNYVGTEHLLLGLLAAGDTAVRGVLAQFGFELEGVRQEIMSLLGITRIAPVAEEPLGLQSDRVRETFAEVLGAGQPPASPTKPLETPDRYRNDPTMKRLVRLLETYHAELKEAGNIGYQERIAQLQALRTELDATLDQFYRRLQGT